MPGLDPEGEGRKLVSDVLRPVDVHVHSPTAHLSGGPDIERAFPEPTTPEKPRQQRFVLFPHLSCGDTFTSQSAKNKQDASWSRFLDLLEYKGDLYSTHVVRVDARGTTKECSTCGVETSKLLWVREHSCPACGHTEDRDLNAAKNILSRGCDKLNIGAGRSESTPVQTVLPAFARHSRWVDAKHVVEAGSPAA